jgi:hypothetical protein
MKNEEWINLGKALLSGEQELKELKLNKKEYKFNDKQTDFICDFKSRYCLNSGGYGSGKSLALYIKLVLLCKCFPNNRVLLGRKTLSDIDRAILPDLFEIMPRHWFEHRVKDGIINFTNGSQIVLFGLDALQSGGMADIKKAQQKLKSLNLGAYFIDQLEEVEYEVFETLNSRLRRADVPFRQGNMTCNPANFWAYHYFKLQQRRDINGNWIPKAEGDSSLTESSMLDNKDHLPEDYIKDQLAQDQDYVKRFVYGEWSTDILLKGTVFAKEYIHALELMRKAPLEIREGCEIYEEAIASETYRIGIDPSEGIVDPSAIAVISSSGRKVASFCGMCTIPELADKIKFLYYQYNKAKVIPEVNKSSLLEHIKDLNVYKRRHFDYKLKKETEKLGFVTSWSTKQALITHFQQLLRNGIPKIYDQKTTEEMKVFVWSDEAARQGAGASRGFHDDNIMATLLAFWDFHPNKAIKQRAAKLQPRIKKRFQYK